jgi:formate hydrogenlyase subunit 6/NADH:ubiquinone oxidoreductase subunit I
MSKKQAVLFSIGWNACINCGACVAICPQPKPFISSFDTISVTEPCDIACMLCEDICPVTTIEHTEVNELISMVSKKFKSSNNS